MSLLCQAQCAQERLKNNCKLLSLISLSSLNMHKNFAAESPRFKVFFAENRFRGCCYLTFFSMCFHVIRHTAYSRAGKYYIILCRKNQKTNLHNYNSLEPALEFNEKQIEVKIGKTITPLRKEKLNIYNQ